MKKYKILTLVSVVFACLIVASSCVKGDALNTSADADIIDPAQIVTLREISVAKASNDIEFSEPSGFYSDVVIELANCTEDYTLDIRYTTDGSEPTETSNIYSKAIRRGAPSDTSQITSLVVRAALFDGEKRVSKVFTNSYILGYKLKDRFDVPVVCVSTGEENLWNYEYGIFADGKLRDDWLAEQKEQRPNRRLTWDQIFTAPSNWWSRGKEWERPAYLEIFEPNGTRVVAQNVGIRVHGGWSRGNETQKSLRVFARSEYDSEYSSIDYEIFTENTSLDGINKRITSYKRLLLRNTGNDFGNTRIRDEVMQDIASLYGVDMQTSRAAVIFLNGEVYGVTQIKQTLCRFTLEDAYNAPNDNFTVLKQATSSGGYRATEGPVEDEEEYANLVKQISRGLAKTEDGQKIIEEQMDVYNVLKYYAFQIYIGNGDWPHNNFKLYRYNSPELNSAGVEQLDGRWRYWLYDTDFGMGLSGGVDNNILGSCLTSKGDGGLFAGLMQSEEYKNMFIKLMCDLINVYYTRDNLFYYIGCRSLEIAKEIVLQQSRTSWNNNVAVMYDWVENKPPVMYKHLVRHLKADGQYEISFSQNTDGGTSYINKFELTDAYWTGYHYANTGAEMSASPLPGWKLEKWIINGEDVHDAVVSLDKYIAEDKVNIKAVFVKDNSLSGVLVINEAYSDPDGSGYGYIELYNPTNAEVSTDAYSIVVRNLYEATQSEHTLPSKTIAPFSYVTIYCDAQNTDGRFVLKGGRDEIILMRSGTAVETIALPEVEKSESYGRYPDGGKLSYLQELTPDIKNIRGGERITEYEYMKNRVMLTGRLQGKDVVPVRMDGKVYIPFEVVEEYNGSNPASIKSLARQERVDIDGKWYVALDVFEETNVRINDVILDKLNSVIIYK